MAEPTVGFIGLGGMGERMANTLLDGGYTVVGHNRSPEPVERLVDRGGEAAPSPRAVAKRCDVVLTSLPDIAAVEDVIAGEDGVIEGLDGREVVVDTSTASPSAIEELAELVAAAGGTMLDAPVSGGRSGAEEGTLSIMVGGDPAALEAVRGVLETLGTTITHCGPPGSGQTTKACNQIVVSATMAAIGEALVFAAKAGADLSSVLAAISDGAAACWALDNRAPDMVEGDFEPGFPAEYQYKDLRIAAEAGDDYEVPMNTTNATKELFEAAVAMGHGAESNAAVIKAVEALAGAEARLDG